MAGGRGAPSAPVAVVHISRVGKNGRSITVNNFHSSAASGHGDHLAVVTNVYKFHTFIPLSIKKIVKRGQKPTEKFVFVVLFTASYVVDFYLILPMQNGTP